MHLCGWAMQCCMCAGSAKKQRLTMPTIWPASCAYPPNLPSSDMPGSASYVSSSAPVTATIWHLPTAWAVNNSHYLTTHLNYSILYILIGCHLSSTGIVVAGLCNAVCVQEVQKTSGLPCPLSGQPAAHTLPKALLLGSASYVSSSTLGRHFFGWAKDCCI
jgi:hypothetical protein